MKVGVLRSERGKIRGGKGKKPKGHAPGLG